MFADIQYISQYFFNVFCIGHYKKTIKIKRVHLNHCNIHMLHKPNHYENIMNIQFIARLSEWYVLKKFFAIILGVPSFLYLVSSRFLFELSLFCEQYVYYFSTTLLYLCTVEGNSSEHCLRDTGPFQLISHQLVDIR